MRVLIFGGRDWDNQALVDATLDRLHSEHGFSMVIHGAQVSFDRDTGRTWGADYQADVWAKSRGLGSIIRRFPAQWRRFGLAGGPLRNQKMLDLAKPEMAVQFGRGIKGTPQMRGLLDEAGVRVVEVLGV